MIDEVIRPGLISPSDTCYVNTFMQLFFHIIPRRLLIVTWPNWDLMISALHLMFVAMSQDRLIDAVSLSTVCEPDVCDGKDCFELCLQCLYILGALRDVSSGTPRDIIQQLFCSRQITRFSTPFSSRRVSDRHSFFWHLHVSGSSTWIECLNSCLRVIQLDAEPPQTQQNFIRSFPRFFFLSLSHHVWTNNHMVKDYSRVKFPVILDMVFLTRQSRERLKSLNDVPQNIRPTDSIEWHWGRGCSGVGSIPRQLPGNRRASSTTTILHCVVSN
jgi:hypothetical protein